MVTNCQFASNLLATSFRSAYLIHVRAGTRMRKEFFVVHIDGFRNSFKASSKQDQRKPTTPLREHDERPAVTQEQEQLEQDLDAIWRKYFGVGMLRLR